MSKRSVVDQEKLERISQTQKDILRNMCDAKERISRAKNLANEFFSLCGASSDFEKFFSIILLGVASDIEGELEVIKLFMPNK